jgi:predicted dehydrogenase
MLRMGVVGYGYWGPNLVRNFVESHGCAVEAVCDLRPERLDLVRRRYPTIHTTASFEDILKNSTIDAIAISTPVSTHFELALRALRSGRHVLIEKPLAASSTQAIQLVEEAERRKLILMVDHTFVYTGAVRKIRELTHGGEMGDIYYYDSTRVNLGLFQHDVDVMWDLAVHDLSIMDFVLPFKPCAVSATGINHLPGYTENIAYLTLFFDTSAIAHIHVNWLSPVKIRRTLLGGSRQMIVYDDLDHAEKVKIYDKGITLSPSSDNLYKMLVAYRVGDMHAPQIDWTEALNLEVEDFRESIEKGRQPISGGAEGLQVVRILEAATRSMKERGQPVELTARSLTA